MEIVERVNRLLRQKKIPAIISEMSGKGVAGMLVIEKTDPLTEEQIGRLDNICDNLLTIDGYAVQRSYQS